MAAEWFSGVSELELPAKVTDYDGHEVDAQAAQWLIDVLTALEPFVPSLRELRARTRAAQPAGAPSGSSAGAASGATVFGRPPAPGGLEPGP